MVGIWHAAQEGDVGEVERLVGHDPGLLDARDGYTWTPLTCASFGGHTGLVRLLLDKGAALDAQDDCQRTVLYFACCFGRTPVVRLLLERGADPAIARQGDWTPLMAASYKGHLEIVRVLLGHPSAKASINRRDETGRTALWRACQMGRGGIARALLEGGADPTTADSNGITPMAIAKETAPLPYGVTAEGRRECVAALEVSSCSPRPSPLLLIS
jgi:ankyrin repeat protein